MITPEQAHNLIARLFSPVPEIRRQAARELHELHRLHADVESRENGSYLVTFSEYNNQCPTDEDPLKNHPELREESPNDKKNDLIAELQQVYEENPTVKQLATLRLINEFNQSTELMNKDAETIAKLIWEHEYLPKLNNQQTSEVKQPKLNPSRVKQLVFKTLKKLYESQPAKKQEAESFLIDRCAFGEDIRNSSNNTIAYLMAKHGYNYHPKSKKENEAFTESDQFYAHALGVKL